MRYVLNPKAIFHTMEDKMVVWNPENGHTIVLNHTGWHILYLIDSGTDTYEGIVRALAEEYGLPVEEVEGDVREFLKEMEEVGLIWKGGS